MRDAGCGMRDESENEGRIRDNMTFNVAMRDKKYFAGSGICSF